MNERLQTKYNSLEPDQQRIVRAAVERHRQACEKTKVGIDPMFVEELLNEVVSGREIFV